jgi:hypothetical protein
MIAFQAGHDMTTVEVERRKFKPIEIRHLLIYKIVVWTVVTVSFAVMVAIELHQYECYLNNQGDTQQAIDQRNDCISTSFHVNRIISVS